MLKLFYKRKYIKKLLLLSVPESAFLVISVAFEIIIIVSLEGCVDWQDDIVHIDKVIMITIKIEI